MNETGKLSEKKAIEKTTAEKFLTFYNAQMGTSYSIVELSESPDIRCIDSDGNKLNLEITLSEDCNGDIQSLLGRADHRNIDRSIEGLRAHQERVKQGKESIFDRVSCLSGNSGSMMIMRIQKKLTKAYGPNTALVARDTSGVDWDWNSVIDDIKAQLNLSQNPFDKGIWILSDSRLLRVDCSDKSS